MKEDGDGNEKENEKEKATICRPSMLERMK